MQHEALPLFLNPAAGRGRAGRKAAGIASLFAAEGIAVAVVLSRAVGDLEARVLEHARSGCGPLIVAGGDGSVHEAVNGILRSGSPCGFGLVPVGTGNDFAKAAAIPLDWRTAASELAARIRTREAPKAIDAGIMNGRFFANGAGIGFDAKVNRIARRYRLPIGDFVYLAAVIEALWDGVITPTVHLRYGDTRQSGPVTLANVSNGPWVGGMFHIAPGAANDDGEFDLVIAGPVTRRRVLALLPKLMRGRHLAEHDIRHVRVRDFELVAEEPLPSHLDGEVQPLQSEFRIGLLPAALQVL